MEASASAACRALAQFLGRHHLAIEHPAQERPAGFRAWAARSGRLSTAPAGAGVAAQAGNAAVARPAVSLQNELEDALLADRDAVEPAAVELNIAPPPSLTTRSAYAFSGSARQPAGAEVAHLLVGGDDHLQLAGGGSNSISARCAAAATSVATWSFMSWPPSARSRRGRRPTTGRTTTRPGWPGPCRRGSGSRGPGLRRYSATGRSGSAAPGSASSSSQSKPASPRVAAISSCAGLVARRVHRVDADQLREQFHRLGAKPAPFGHASGPFPQRSTRTGGRFRRNAARRPTRPLHPGRLRGRPPPGRLR